MRLSIFKTSLHNLLNNLNVSQKINLVKKTRCSGINLGLFVLTLTLFSHATQKEILGGHEGWLDRMGGGVRELGMGNTGTALLNSMPAAYWNPASLAGLRKKDLALGADVRALQRHGGIVAIQGPVAANLGMGIGVLSRGDWEVKAYNADEEYIGTARPQAFGTYVGAGFRLTRQQAIGLSMVWYNSHLDIEGGAGAINQIGIFNLGYLQQWKNGLQAGVSLRNLGMNSKLSANFELTTITATGPADLDQTGNDFHPKTLIGALAYNWKEAPYGPVLFTGELINYQLKDAFFVIDANFHHQDFRLGAEWSPFDNLQVRTGYDRGNYSVGFGYKRNLRRKKVISFDYAMVIERHFVHFNPYGFGIRYHF